MTGNPETPEVVNSVKTPAEELTRNEQVSHYIDLYKQSVSVQMHFNDIEWRIRGLALTAATFSLGAAGVAAKDGTQVGCVSLGTVVLAIGLLLWYAFYFVDQAWYHPLLKAAVDNGTAIEKEISESLPQANMTTTITENSGYQTKRVVRFLSGKESMRSADKLVWFYKIGATALALAAIALQIGAMLGTSPAKGNPAPVPTPSASAASDAPIDMQK
ncbi:hypothetical protein [Kocuria rhizophila]|uniref:hypothetical protein n=1 Tax=Kocuria rhizophila TaxID=72000 RepID=UPI0018D2626F|nr:hypothetical protein [Kocuria rhizophila]